MSVLLLNPPARAFNGLTVSVLYPCIKLCPNSVEILQPSCRRTVLIAGRCLPNLCLKYIAYSILKALKSLQD